MKDNDRSMNNQQFPESKVEEMPPPAKKRKSGVGTARMLMRLLLGSVIIGREELKHRFQGKQSGENISPADLNAKVPIETEEDRARYAAIGAVAKTSDAVQRRLSKLGQITNRAYGFFNRVVSPVSNSRLMSPFRRRYQSYIDQGEKVVANWVAAGRTEEYLSRQLVQNTTTETIEEVLDYLAESPEMDELTQAQSTDLIGDMFEGVQENVSNTRLVFINWISSMIRSRPYRKIIATPNQQSSSEIQSPNQEIDEN